MKLQWDDAKNLSNIDKHGFPFQIAYSVLSGNILKKPSDQNGEERYIAIGPYENRMVTVVFTVRDDHYRIISIRSSRREEKRAYNNLYPGRAK